MKAAAFRFLGAGYDDGAARLRYAFDDGPELVETLRFPAPPPLPADRAGAFAAALRLLHLVAGISYYKAAVPPGIEVAGEPLDTATAAMLDEIYTEGLGEFALQNDLDLRGRVRFPHSGRTVPAAVPLDLPRRSLLPVGGGKDSLVSLELLRGAGEPLTPVWVGRSALIAACVQASGLDGLNIERELSPLLFEMNRQGALNGHIPVTAINSAILVVAALLYGYDAIVFSNERSASAPTLERDGRAVNHQWSKGLRFESLLREHLAQRVTPSLDYFSLLRPLSELAVTARFAALDRYFEVFSSCNRNFRILGTRPTSRWCGQCPKCHFVFLALAPFLPKPRLTAIFGRNLLDDEALIPAFEALMAFRADKPFECVGEADESRAALHALSVRAEWREDAVVAHYRRRVLPAIGGEGLELEALMAPAGAHHLPPRLAGLFDEAR
ncbi:MAG TPA: endonuclease domain-containing protein [Xanthomonadaceae bacterium]|nr:endonuclease domain-containing protein [Xanthomonadaceae bacterium]